MARNIIFSEAIIALSAFLCIQCVVLAQDTEPVPADKSQVNAWFDKIVGPISDRQAILDPALLAAEAEAPRIINLNADGSGDFKTLTDAINEIPEGNQKRVVIKLGPGNYTEKVAIPASKPFVTLYGDPAAMPVVVFNGTARQFGTVDSASLIVDSDYFIGANLVLVNSAPRPDGGQQGSQAEAVRIGGDKGVFYNTKFYGFQDTVCDDKGMHLFKDCYIEGTIDFIWGNGKTIYLNTEIHDLPEVYEAWITAQARHNAQEDTAFSFLHCSVTGSGGHAFLGRTFMPYARVVFAYTEMSDVVDPAGWSNNNDIGTEKTAFFGEFNNNGAGANFDQRVPFTKKLTESETQPFLSLGFIQASKWLLPIPKY